MARRASAFRASAPECVPGNDSELISDWFLFPLPGPAGRDGATAGATGARSSARSPTTVARYGSISSHGVPSKDTDTRP